MPRAAIEDARPYCDWSMVVPILILNPASLAAPAAPSLPPTERHRHPRYFLLRGRSGSFVAPAGPPPSGAAPASSSIYYATSFFFARMPYFFRWLRAVAVGVGVGVGVAVAVAVAVMMAVAANWQWLRTAKCTCTRTRVLLGYPRKEEKKKQPGCGLPCRGRCL